MAPARLDPVLAAVEKEWFAWAAEENLVARWVETRSLGGQVYVQRQKDDGRGRGERTLELNGSWVLLNRSINGHSSPILTVQNSKRLSFHFTLNTKVLLYASVLAAH